MKKRWFVHLNVSKFAVVALKASSFDICVSCAICFVTVDFDFIC